MLLRNFKPKASRIKAKTTLTELSHPPDLGNLLSADGKMASSVNGNANASPKKNIPSRGRRPPPCTASIISAPINGPVQEKETITVVSAMKNAPTSPPFSALESVLLTRLLGSKISNAPKKETAKIKNSKKNSRLGIQCVLNIFPTLGPNSPNVNSAPNREKISTMENPKKSPLRIAFARFSLPCMKKETIIGIIGKTQGVKIAAKPASADIKIKSQRVCPVDEALCPISGVAASSFSVTALF